LKASSSPARPVPGPSRTGTVIFESDTGTCHTPSAGLRRRRRPRPRRRQALRARRLHGLGQPPSACAASESVCPPSTASHRDSDPQARGWSRELECTRRRPTPIDSGIITGTQWSQCISWAFCPLPVAVASPRLGEHWQRRLHRVSVPVSPLSRPPGQLMTRIFGPMPSVHSLSTFPILLPASSLAGFFES
jgi:hypothetical protein